jgi:uncharacterized protein YerC
MSTKDTIDSLSLEAYQSILTANDTLALDQLLTTSEKMKIGRRVMVAQAIMLGKTRMEIQAKIGVSPNTFTQIRLWIESECSDYVSAHEPQKIVRGSRHRTPGAPFSYDEMSARYPGHFLLISGIKKLFS